jgi:integrase
MNNALKTSKNNLSVLFWLRSNKPSRKTGLFPICCRVTLNTERANDFAIGMALQPENWHAKSQTVITGNEQAEVYNEQLQRLKMDLQKVFAKYEISGTPFTAQHICNYYLNRAEHKPTKALNPPLVALMTDYRDYREDREDLSESNSKKISAMIRTMKGFCLQMYENVHTTVLELKEVEFTEKLEFYFSKIKAYSHNFKVKSYQLLRSIFHWSIKHKKISHNPMQCLEIPHKEPPKPVVYLTEPELEKMYYFKFFAESLQQTVDCFLFSCYSGLAYIDLRDLKTDQIHTDKEGLQWIRGNRTKTKTGFLVPLLPRAKEILQKYGGKPENLPVAHNAVYNRLLKQVGAMLDINKVLTTHVARKTFAMHALNVWDIPLETVSRMLGHANIKITQSTYCQVNESRIKKDTIKLLQTQNLIIEPSQTDISKFSTI